MNKHPAHLAHTSITQKGAGFREAVIERLVKENGFRREGDYLRNGRCPKCGQEELWTEIARPYTLFCNRSNSCAGVFPLGDFLPDLFRSFGHFHPASPSDPTATAKAYLQARGIDTQLLQRGSQPIFFQGRWSVKGEEGRKKGWSTAAFPLPDDGISKREPATWHRLIDYEGRDKGRFHGGYKGRVWHLPEFKGTGEVWLVEGIIDALSLIQSGLEAVAVLSCSAIPRTWLDAVAHRNSSLVIALDNDSAGRKGAHKLVQACALRKIPHRMALPPEELDWNDLLLQGALAPGRQAETLEIAFWRGELEQATNPEVFYRVYSRRHSARLFRFRGSLFAPGTEKEGGFARKVSNFWLEPLARTRRQVAPGSWEFARRFRVHNHQHKVEILLKGSQFTDYRAFARALEEQASCDWYGTQGDLNALRVLVDQKNVPITRELDVIGFDAHSNTFLFPDLAYGPEGEVISPNSAGSFHVRGEHLVLNPVTAEAIPVRESGLDGRQLLEFLHQAYGPKGWAALGFFTASYFAVPFSSRPQSRFFPFLSLVGPHGSGKSSLIQILNSMHGRDPKAGLTLAESNTRIFKARSMGLASGLCTVVYEMDERTAKTYDWSQFLTLYDRMPAQGRAAKTNDNRVVWTEFSGTLAFNQNREHYPRPEHKSRVVSLLFKKEEHSRASAQALAAIQQIPVSYLVDYRHRVLSSRADLYPRFLERFDIFTQSLRDAGINDDRIAKNHALVLAGAGAAFSVYLPPEISERNMRDLSQYMIACARAKMRSLRELPDQLREFFGDLLSLLANGKYPDYAANVQAIKGVTIPLERCLAFNLNGVEAALAKDHARFDTKAQVRAQLAEFNGVLARDVSIRDKSTATTVKCWAVDREAIE